MKDLLCDISAFRYWRLPPQVRALCPPLPRPEEDRQRYDLARNPTAAVVLGFMVAYAAMFGFDKLKEVIAQLDKNKKE